MDLHRVTRDELVGSLAHALANDPAPFMRDIMATLAAEALADRLEAAGFVVLRRPSAVGHATGD